MFVFIWPEISHGQKGAMLLRDAPGDSLVQYNIHTEVHNLDGSLTPSPLTASVDNPD